MISFIWTMIKFHTKVLFSDQIKQERSQEFRKIFIFPIFPHHFLLYPCLIKGLFYTCIFAENSYLFILNTKNGIKQ
ncbi:hypothetical protein HMPREF1991_00801 [Hoylesella loescheii DSM 19665 = JCM 12249 = ATCC 15930]|uniref:Uncharacterized protein n=1 Tax=Hoylesella loescheii DSM 19665 = JCM 12249 = ATCC 15930 TaxID=1122985 RepID=A0A069QJX8_HOYLO|nr:hypothetical protein HMPREF1991_00801 [Hoylesella loescheii DSM 19665 = JCM 12249 = ATCC 15930]